jgi:hypothetical protein
MGTKFSTSYGGTVSALGGFSGSLTQLTNGVPFITAPASNAITIATGSSGQIILSGTIGAPTTAQFLTLATDATLSGERVFVPSTGLSATDGGANGNYTLTVNNGVFASLSGSNFTGAVSHDSSGISALTKGTDVFFYVSGSIGLASGATRKVAVFGGDVVVSGSVVANGISGSLQKLTNGTSYLVASGNIQIASGTSGQITVSTIPLSWATLRTDVALTSTDPTFVDLLTVTASGSLFKVEAFASGLSAGGVTPRLRVLVDGSAAEYLTFYGSSVTAASSGVQVSVLGIFSGSSGLHTFKSQGSYAGTTGWTVHGQTNPTREGSWLIVTPLAP